MGLGDLACYKCEYYVGGRCTVYAYLVKKTRRDKKKKGIDWRPDLRCPKAPVGRENIAIYKAGQYKKWKAKARTMRDEVSKVRG